MEGNQTEGIRRPGRYLTQLKARYFLNEDRDNWKECNIINIDDFVKSPSAALRCILSHCGVHTSTPHSFVFACLASEAFYFIV